MPHTTAPRNSAGLVLGTKLFNEGVNGQERTVEECRERLSAATQLIRDDRREDGLRGGPEDAPKGTVTIQ